MEIKESIRFMDFVVAKSLNMRLKTVIFIIICLAVLSCSLKNKLLIIDENDNYCLPNSEFRVGEICYQDSISKIKEILGEPYEIDEYLDLNLKTWKYKDFVIEFHNNLVWSVKFLNEKYTTPSGLKLGLSKSEVIQKLGYNIKDNGVIVSEDNLEFQIINCELGNYMIFKFDSNDKLIGLEFDNDIP